MAYIKDDGTVCSDDLSNYVRPQTTSEIQARQAEAEAQAEAQAERAVARTELLDRLGITADEAKLLLG